MSSRVREPIQVYLSTAEREALDRAAAELGVSRSEVLRRGAASIASGSRRAAGPLGPLAEAGWVETASAPEGSIPPALPSVPLATLLDGLLADRTER